MRIALLGADDDTVSLAASLQHAGPGGGQVVWAYGAGGFTERLQAIAPFAVLAGDWESLLAGNVADAVLVARPVSDAAADKDERAVQLRMLFQAKVPVLVAHPVHDSMLVYYELDMIRRETGCLALPYLPQRWHPACEVLRAIIGREAGGKPDRSVAQEKLSIGAVEQVHFERPLADRRRAEVLAWFARDVDLLRALCGELTKVSALGPQAGAEHYGSLGVQLSGPAGLVCRWSVAAADGAAQPRLQLLGSAGKATLHMPPGSQPWNLTVQSRGLHEQTFPVWDPAAVFLEGFARALAGEAVGLDWVDGARAVEIAESIDRSLAKGRTVEMHFDDYTEQATFKGTMTSLGCGLIVAGLATWIVAAVLAKTKLAPWAGYWPYVLLGIFGLFLSLQCLQLVFKPKA